MTDDFGGPADPFELNLPGIENAPEDVQKFFRDFSNARHDYSALLHQQSFRKLRTAVEALDEDQLRSALLRAIATSILIHMTVQAQNPERFARWLQAP